MRSMSVWGPHWNVLVATPFANSMGPSDLHTTSPSPALSGILSLDWTATTAGISVTPGPACSSKVMAFLSLDAVYLIFLHSTE